MPIEPKKLVLGNETGAGGKQNRTKRRKNLPLLKNSSELEFNKEWSRGSKYSINCHPSFSFSLSKGMMEGYKEKTLWVKMFV